MCLSAFGHDLHFAFPKHDESKDNKIHLLSNHKVMFAKVSNHPPFFEYAEGFDLIKNLVILKVQTKSVLRIESFVKPGMIPFGSSNALFFLVCNSGRTRSNKGSIVYIQTQLSCLFKNDVCLKQTNSSWITHFL